MALMGRATHVIQWVVQRVAKARAGAKPLKPDWSLQLDSMKSESLVIANQNVAVNTFPGLVHTARHVMEVGCTRSGLFNLRENGHHGVIHNWDEVVTR